MRPRILGLILLAMSPALLVVRTPSSPGRAAEPGVRPAYKNPLFISVDNEGKKAIVELMGVSTWVYVDLVRGKFDRLRQEPTDDFKDMMRTNYVEYEVEKLLSLQITEGNGFAGARPSKDYNPVVHQRPKFKIPSSQVTQGWIFTNVLSLLRDKDDKGNRLPSLTAALDEPQQGYANPTDVVITPNGYAFVACGGADLVLVIDLKAFEKHASTLKWVDRQDNRRRPKDGWRLGRPNFVLDGPDDLTASRHFIKAKLPTQANPRRLGLSGDGKTLVVSNYLGDSLTVIDTEKLKVVKHISLGGPPPDAARRGEILFNSGKMTFQGAFTCASCHPNGGADGLNWDLSRDGVGNFKNTKSLLGIGDTGPYGWEGTSVTLEDRITGTLRTLHQHEPMGTEVADLAAYLRSLPPPKPEPVGEKEKEAVARGAALFQEKARCATCHKRAGYDDGQSHNVGMGGPADTTDLFDTPSLRGVSRTAPYLHDGRAATLEEIFTKHNPEKRHGATHLLSKEELEDLIWFLRSL